MNPQISTLLIAAIASFCLATPSVYSAESASAWIYPESKLRTKVGPAKESASVWPNESIQVRSTQDSIAKVVAYYVKQSGFEPLNWKILGREFPYSKQLPVGFWIGPGKTSVGNSRVSITHDLRPSVAQVTFLVIPESGTITSISITRGKNEAETWIQVHQHPPRDVAKTGCASETPAPRYSGTIVSHVDSYGSGTGTSTRLSTSGQMGSGFNYGDTAKADWTAKIQWSFQKRKDSADVYRVEIAFNSPNGISSSKVATLLFDGVTSAKITVNEQLIISIDPEDLSG